MTSLGLIQDIEDDVKIAVDKIEGFVTTLTNIDITDVKDFESFISKHAIQILQFISQSKSIASVLESLPESVIDKIKDILSMFIDRVSQSLLSIDINDTLINNILNLLSPSTPYDQSIGKKLYDSIPDNLVYLKSLVFNLSLVSVDELRIIIKDVLSDIDSVVEIIDQMKSITDINFISGLFNQLGLLSVVNAIILQIPVLGEITEGLTIVIIIVSLIISAYKQSRNKLEYYIDNIFGVDDNIKTQIVNLVIKHQPKPV
jgi:hypothetical protein